MQLKKTLKKRNCENIRDRGCLKHTFSPFPGTPRGEQKGSLSEGPGTQGVPGFRILRFRMQNSLPQTTACGRDDVFFYFGPKFEHLRTP